MVSNFFMKKIVFFLILFSELIFAQDINFIKLENQINENNRAGKQQISQKKLLVILERNNISSKDRIKLNLLMATTFRSVGDCGAAINQLQKTLDLFKNLTGEDSLRTSINAELAFVYFDDNNYNKSEKFIKDLYAKDFAFLDDDDKAYVIMQQGYIYYLNKNYELANVEYEKSLSILKKASPCNQPVVLVKQMQLYGKINKLCLVSETYNKTMSLASSFKILKYQIYATEEIKSIYQQNGNNDLALFYSNKLEALKIRFNKDQNISTMHVNNEQFLEKEKDKTDQNFYLVLILSFFGLSLFTGAGIFLFRKSVTYKKQKEKFEDENNQIKEDLENFIKIKPLQLVEKHEILNSEFLNERQKGLLKLISEGFTNKEIAEKLFISENTVKYHVRNIYTILDLKDRKDLFKKLKN